MNPRLLWRFCSHLVANVCYLLDCVFESALEINSNQPIRDLNEINWHAIYKLFHSPSSKGRFAHCWTSLQGHLYRMNWSARRLYRVLDKKSWKKRNFVWTIIKVRYSASNNKTMINELLSFLVMDVVLFSFSWLLTSKDYKPIISRL